MKLQPGLKIDEFDRSVNGKDRVDVSDLNVKSEPFPGPGDISRVKNLRTLKLFLFPA